MSRLRFAGIWVLTQNTTRKNPRSSNTLLAPQLLYLESSYAPIIGVWVPRWHDTRMMSPFSLSHSFYSFGTFTNRSKLTFNKRKILSLFVRLISDQILRRRFVNYFSSNKQLRRNLTQWTQWQRLTVCCKYRKILLQISRPTFSNLFPLTIDYPGCTV